MVIHFGRLQWHLDREKLRALASCRLAWTWRGVVRQRSNFSPAAVLAGGRRPEHVREAFRIAGAELPEAGDCELRYEGVTDPAETGRRVAEGFVPILREIPGFVSYYWLDAGGGVLVSTYLRRSPSDRGHLRRSRRCVGIEQASGRLGGRILRTCCQTRLKSRPGEVVAHA